MEIEKDHFKQKMKKALGSKFEIQGTKDFLAKENVSVNVDLPERRKRKNGYLSCRCTRETEDSILELVQKTGLSQSEIINHLLEISLPILVDKYLKN